MNTMESRIQAAQYEGNETAAVALADNPTDMAAVDAAWDAGARWSRQEGMYALSLPGSLETIALADPADMTVEFGSGISAFRV